MENLSRRSLVHAGAWSVPVVLAAVAAPSASASADLSFVALSLGDWVWSWRYVTAVVSLRDESPVGIDVTFELEWREPGNWVQSKVATTTAAGENGTATTNLYAEPNFFGYRAWVLYKGERLYSPRVANV